MGLLFCAPCTTFKSEMCLKHPGKLRPVQTIRTCGVRTVRIRELRECTGVQKR